MKLEDKKKLLKKGIDSGNFPKILYKYRTINQTKAILDNFSFWFATPDSFNDPFDCNLSEVDTPSLGDAIKHFKRLGIQESVINQSIDLYRRHPEKLIELVKDTKEKSICSNGVLSLSEKYDDILMWSHYSEYHKGIVLGLSLEDDLEFFVSPIRIDYKDNYEALNYLNDPEKSIIDTLKIKSSQWKYEREIRIYKNNSGLYKINETAIKEIYFGIKTRKEDIEEIYQICEKQNLNHIKFFKGHQSYGTFEVKFKQTSPVTR
jgi:hypothetical protein